MEKLFLAKVTLYSEKYDEFQSFKEVKLHIVKAEHGDIIETKVRDHYKNLTAETRTEFTIENIEVTESIE